MPRNFGQFTTSIYRDDDFRALTLAQQGAYYLLGLQADVSAAGVLTLALGRWASKAAGLTREGLATELAVLEERGHIAIDHATEELLIVKFAKWDRGWANRLRRPVLIAAVRAIESVHIRDIAVDELRKVALSDAASADEKVARDALSDALSALDRVVVTEGDRRPEPQPSNHEGEPSVDDDEPPAEFCPKHPTGTTEPCGPCGTAKRMNRAWHDRQAVAGEAKRAEMRAAIRNCTACDNNGLVQVDVGKVARCNHQPVTAIREAS